MITEDGLKRFWKTEGPKSAGVIIDWIRRFKYLPKSRRAVIWRQAIKDLPEDVKRYLREWRGEL